MSVVTTDGWTPDIDSDAYVRGNPSNSTVSCRIDKLRKTKRCADRRLIVQPWAARSTPVEIQENKKDVKQRAAISDRQQAMHFQGSIWDCNIDSVLQFTKGCAEEGLEVIRYGDNLESEVLRFYHDNLREQLFDQDNFFMEQSPLSLQQLFEKKSTPYAPSFQGECHFADDKSESYIADRILNLIAIGTWPMTNNPASFELLGNSSAIVFDTNVTNLCRMASRHRPSIESLHKLMDVVALNHTYISRLSTILQFITDEVPKANWYQDTPKAAWHSTSKKTLATEPMASVALDTSSLKLALQECTRNIDCVLSRLPLHASWNCSRGVLYGSHNRMGSGLAASLQKYLPCPGSVLNDHMTIQDYQPGRPVIHFIRDPLEVVVSGYQFHSTANTTWLDTSGYKSVLQSKSLANGLEKEFHGAGLWNINNAVGVYQMMKHNATIQKDFFTVRIDDVRDILMFNLTMQAIQRWLGINKPLSWDDLEECCFKPNHVVTDDRIPEMRHKIMDKHSAEVYALRQELDFPAVGLEVWAPPALTSRILAAGGLVTLALLVSVGALKVIPALSSEFFRRKRQETRSYILSGSNEGITSVSGGLAARFCHECSAEIGLFQLRDPFVGLDLDVQATFAPPPAWKTRILRLFLFLWSLHVFWIDMQLFQFPWFYFAFFSQVTFGLTIVYYFVSLCVAFAGPLHQPPTTRRDSQPSLLACIHWVSYVLHFNKGCYSILARLVVPCASLMRHVCFFRVMIVLLASIHLSQACYAGIITSQFVVTTVHWSTNLHFFLNVLPQQQRYPSVMKHGVFFLLTLWEGQVYSCIPLRAKLYVFPLAILLLYTAWTYYQSRCYGPSNPFFYGQDHEWAHPDDDDAVYSQLNWHKRPVQSSLGVCCGAVLAPLHFVVLWMVSAWSGGNRWDGKHRRFICAQERKK